MTAKSVTIPSRTFKECCKCRGLNLNCTVCNLHFRHKISSRFVATSGHLETKTTHTKRLMQCDSQTRKATITKTLMLPYRKLDLNLYICNPKRELFNDHTIQQPRTNMIKETNYERIIISFWDKLAVVFYVLENSTRHNRIQNAESTVNFEIRDIFSQMSWARQTCRIWQFKLGVAGCSLLIIKWCSSSLWFMLLNV